MRLVSRLGMLTVWGSSEVSIDQVSNRQLSDRVLAKV